MTDDTPQLALPFRFGANGQPLTVDQDSVEEVADCVETFLRTPLGHFPEQPDYGLLDPSFEEGAVDTQELAAGLAQWEERANVALEQRPDLRDRFTNVLNIQLSTRSGDA